MYFVKITGEKMAKLDLRNAWNCLIIRKSTGKSFSFLNKLAWQQRKTAL
jgi:hypothetical protein